MAAADYWSEMTDALFEATPYHAYSDPLNRLLGYLEFPKAMLPGEMNEFTCLVGTMVQETYDSNPAIQAACKDSIFGHAARLEAGIALAREHYGVPPDLRRKAWRSTQVV